LSKKKRSTKKPQEMTRRQLSKWQQQRKKQRLVLFSGIAIIAAAVVLVLTGWVFTRYLPLQKTAIKVNDTEFSMSYFVQMLRAYGQGQTEGTLGQIAPGIITEIEESELIRQAAGDMGITVSSEAVLAKLQEAGFPDDRVHRDIATITLLREELLGGYIDGLVPETGEQAHINAMLLENERQALEIRERLEGGESFAELAAEFSLDALTREHGGDAGWHTRETFSQLLASEIPVDYAFSGEVGALSAPLNDEQIAKQVGYWIIRILERQGEGEDEQVHAQAIMLGSADEALEYRARLEAGESFAALTEELVPKYLAEPAQGDLGWIRRGLTTTVLDEQLFDAGRELNTLSEPIRDEGVVTRGGCWLVEVIAREADRPINEDDRDAMKSAAFQEWLTSLWDDPENLVEHSYLTDETIAWAVQQALR